MINSLYLALSGMVGHERGLNVIGNNVTNMNTVGFRGSTVSFADVFVGRTSNGMQGGQRGIGAGLDASRSQLDFRFGQPQNTGGELDLALDGEGFFIVQDEAGKIFYTRAGNFDIVDDQLVMKEQKLKVMTRDASGALVPMSIDGLKINAPKATGEVTFEGNLNPADEEKMLSSVVVFDSAGGKHTLSVKFAREDPDADPSGAFATWQITVLENDEIIGEGSVEFTGFRASEPRIDLTLSLQNAGQATVTFDFNDVTGTPFSSTTESDIEVEKQDGFTSGKITARTFDEKGILKLTYSNGQTADGPKLTLARIEDVDNLVQTGDGLFSYLGKQVVSLLDPNDDLRVVAGVLEGSNVNLTTEFSQLILMQRGYQASSQVMSTANDMLQQLFDMRGRR